MTTVTTTPGPGTWAPRHPGGLALSNDDLRSLSPAQQRALARRLATLARSEPAARPDRAPRHAHRRLAVVVVVALICAGLVASASQLATSLPSRYLAGHWDVAWVGYDLIMAAGVAATGLAIWRGSPAIAPLSLATAVMLACDAWFDVATASGGADLITSLLAAGLLELPLAALGVVVAFRAARHLRGVVG
jgi:hypothetical protein